MLQKVKTSRDLRLWQEIVSNLKVYSLLLANYVANCIFARSRN